MLVQLKYYYLKYMKQLLLQNDLKYQKVLRLQIELVYKLNQVLML
jgi:hypothetical protein